MAFSVSVRTVGSPASSGITGVNRAFRDRMHICENTVIVLIGIWENIYNLLASCTVRCELMTNPDWCASWTSVIPDWRQHLS
jgi:hypothetical protein